MRKKLLFSTLLAFSAISLLSSCEERPKTREERIQEVITSIKDKPDWLNLVKKKAEEQKVPLDSMLLKDATWTVDDVDGKHKPQN